MRHVVKPHVVHGVYCVPGKQVDRKRNILIELELCIQHRWWRLLGDWTEERNGVVVWWCAHTPSTDMTQLDHSALLAFIFAHVF